MSIIFGAVDILGEWNVLVRTFVHGFGIIAWNGVDSLNAINGIMTKRRTWIYLHEAYVNPLKNFILTALLSSKVMHVSKIIQNASEIRFSNWVVNLLTSAQLSLYGQLSRFGLQKESRQMLIFRSRYIALK